MTWRTYPLRVGMPHMVPGRLSEVELLKWAGAHQWESIGAELACTEKDIVNEDGDRLYASFIDVEFDLGGPLALDEIGEGETIYLHNQIRFFARRFVDGIFLITRSSELPEAARGVTTREEARAARLPWIAMTNAFVARDESNTRLQLFQPRGLGDARATTAQKPIGMVLHEQAMDAGEASLFSAATGAALEAADPTVLYEISPESDLNGAGLLYFARYVAIMNHGERVFLCERLARPLSREVASALATQHRQIYYFGNADPSDRIRVRVASRITTPEARGDAPSRRLDVEAMASLSFLFELERVSDGRLIALAAARKSLNLATRSKPGRGEVQRLLRRLGIGG